MVLLRVRIDDADGSDDRGGERVVEFDVEEQPGMVPLSTRRPDIAVAPYSLASALDQALPALALTMRKLRRAVSGAEEVSVEVGLKVGGETGVVFVRGTADATFRATVTWRRPDGAAGGTDDAR